MSSDGRGHLDCGGNPIPHFATMTVHDRLPGQVVLVYRDLAFFCPVCHKKAKYGLQRRSQIDVFL